MASGVRSDELLEYFDKVSSWDATEAKRAKAEKRKAYRIAAGAGAVALAAVALYLLSPLKIVEPYVVRVDEKLGAVDVVSVLRDTETITADEAVRKYFLAEYVKSRESWIPDAREEMYRKTVSMTSTAEGGRLRAARDPSNPRSPVVLYRSGETAAVTVRSVAFISESVGQVRYSQSVIGSGMNPLRTDWVATVEFEFAEEPTSDATKFYNPLGFLVTTYRVDRELGGGQL